MSVPTLRIRTDTERKNPYIKPADLIEYLEHLSWHHMSLNKSGEARACKWLIEDIKESVKEANR
jgi:hypothetical protein